MQFNTEIHALTDLVRLLGMFRSMGLSALLHAGYWSTANWILLVFHSCRVAAARPASRAGVVVRATSESSRREVRTLLKCARPFLDAS
jgi:hypothetical protein